MFKPGTLAIYGGSRVRDDLASQVKAPLLGACGNDPVDSLINPSQVSLDGPPFRIGKFGHAEAVLIKLLPVFIGFPDDGQTTTAPDAALVRAKNVDGL